MNRPTARERRDMIAALAVAQQIAMTIDTKPEHFEVHQNMVRVYLHRNPSAVEAFALRFEATLTCGPHGVGSVITRAVVELADVQIEAWSLDEAPQEIPDIEVAELVTS
jgi:hypothetical protein